MNSTSNNITITVTANGDNEKSIIGNSILVMLKKHNITNVKLDDAEGDRIDDLNPDLIRLSDKLNNSGVLIKVTKGSNKTANQLFIEALEHELFSTPLKSIIESDHFPPFVLKENDWIINTYNGNCNKVKSIDRDSDRLEFYIPDCFKTTDGILSFWENTSGSKGGVVRYATEFEILNKLREAINEENEISVK